MEPTILILTSIASFLVGGLVRYWDVVIKGNTTLNKKNLSWRQVLYSLCFAYPFCAAYLYLETIF